MKTHFNQSFKKTNYHQKRKHGIKIGFLFDMEVKL